MRLALGGQLIELDSVCNDISVSFAACVNRMKHLLVELENIWAHFFHSNTSEFENFEMKSIFVEKNYYVMATF